MVSSRKGNDGLLARVNFPLYSMEMLTSRHVLVAGGGGSANTGVANGFEIYEIYHNGNRFVAEEVVRHETGSSVVMNCAVRSNNHRSYLVAGQESHCQLYHVNMSVVDTDSDNIETLKPSRHLTRRTSNAIANEAVRNRKGSNSTNQSNVTSKINENQTRETKISFEIKPGDLTQTDFSSQDPLQRVVRISLNCKLIATGGIDAHIRIWKFPQMTKLHDINLHTKEIDDLDFSPDNKQLVSIAKDGLAIVWNVETGEEITRLKWDPPEKVKYLFKRCRFGNNESKKEQFRLYTIANPLGKVGKLTGFLQQWDPKQGTLSNSVRIDESLASLAVRDDGRFIAIGTMLSGSVSIYVAFSLQRVLHIPSAHSMFVTGLEFLPIKNNDGPPISSTTEAAVLSISVDNKLCIHSLNYRHTIPVWVAIILIVIVLYLAFVGCSYLGL